MIENLPPVAQRRACDLMAEVAAAGIIDDPDAEELLESLASPDGGVDVLDLSHDQDDELAPMSLTPPAWLLAMADRQ